MKWNQIKNYFVGWLFVAFVLLTIAAATKQVIGPSAPTVANSIVKWIGTDAYRTTNSVVTIDDAGNVSGVAAMSLAQMNTTTAYVTNGYIYLQNANTPGASDIGGTVGSVTNHMIRNVGGNLIDYWSDGTTLWSKQLAP